MEAEFPSLEPLIKHNEVIRFACCLSDQPHRILAFICSRMEEAPNGRQLLRVFEEVIVPICEELAALFHSDKHHNEFWNDLSDQQLEGQSARSRIYTTGKQFGTMTDATILFSSDESPSPSSYTLYTEDGLQFSEVLMKIQKIGGITITKIIGSDVTNQDALMSTLGRRDLQKLRLEDMQIDDEDLSSLAHAGSSGKLPQLKELDLRGNRLTGHLKTLFGDDLGLAFPQLRKLQLMHTHLKHVDMLSLANAIELGKLPNLETLGISRGTNQEAEKILHDICNANGIDIKILSGLSPEQEALATACVKKSMQCFRARINIIGHSGAGKTTLTRRLLGEAYRKIQEDLESTDGIHTHLIKIDPEKIQQKWTEKQLDTRELFSEFQQEVLSRSDVQQRTNNTGHEDEKSSADRSSEKTEQRKEQNDTNRRETANRERTQSSSEEIPQQETPTETKEINLVEDAQEDKAMEGPSARENQFEQNKQTKPNVHQDILQELLDSTKKEETEQHKKKEGFLRIWDFGGQTEFYTTHHLFLDPEAFNIIVMDISKKFKEPFQKTQQYQRSGIPNSQEEFLKYWLRTIYSEAARKKITPHVALVLTHKDQIPSDVDNFTANFIAEVMASLQEKTLDHHLKEKNIHVVNNTAEEDAEFNKLRSDLFTAITIQPMWTQEIPPIWLKLEADVHNLGQKHIPLATVRQLADRCGMNDADLASFLKLFHKIGEFIFPPGFTSNDSLVTDPQWLLDSLKALITTQKFFKTRTLEESIKLDYLSGGVLSAENLHDLWQGKDIEFRIDLMTKLNLIIPLEGRKYLVPAMLPEISEVSANLRISGFVRTCHFFYESASQEMLPLGTVPRLIASIAKEFWVPPDKETLSKTSASFHIRKSIELLLNLDSASSIQVYVRCPHSAVQSDFWSFLLETKGKIDKKASELHLITPLSFSILCPHSTTKLGMVSVLQPEVGKLTPERARCYCHGQPLTSSHFEDLLSNKTTQDEEFAKKVHTKMKTTEQKGTNTPEETKELDQEQGSESKAIQKEKTEVKATPTKKEKIQRKYLYSISQPTRSTVASLQQLATGIKCKYTFIW